jgi:NitT/TauT family transport system substrate-binding protein
MPVVQTRRRFLTAASMAGVVGFVDAPVVQAAEGLLETTTVRLPKPPGLCIAPGYVAEELLRAEGFTDVRYVPTATAIPIEALARGEIDFNLNYSINYVSAIASGKSVTLLAGVHVGCYELFAAEGIRTIATSRARVSG